MTLDTDALPPLRDVIAAAGLDARKSLGQHFLLDLNLTARVVRGAGDLDGVNVIEVGPGPGGLTRVLLESPALCVVAIERDHRCLEALAPLVAAAAGRFRLIAADALAVDMAGLVPAPRAVVANLPYNVATPLLLGWLKEAPSWSGLTLMFQKEVAERLVAAPRTKAYGRLTIMTNWRTEAKLLFDIPARAFTPPPKVVSAVVHLTPRATDLSDPTWESMETVVAAAFGQRRKMLRSSLRTLLGEPLALLTAAGIRPEARAEELNVADFVRLAKLWEASRSGQEGNPTGDPKPAYRPTGDPKPVYRFELCWYWKKRDPCVGSIELAGFSEEDVHHLLNLPSDEDVIGGEYKLTDHMVTELSERFSINTNTDIYDYYLGT